MRLIESDRVLAKATQARPRTRKSTSPDQCLARGRNIGERHVFVIGGITTTSHGFAGVLVGQRAGRTLRFLGTIEMGYSTQAVSELLAKSQRLSSPSSPFVDLPSRRDMTWLAPKLLCEVSYNEIVAVGSERPCGGDSRAGNEDNTREASSCAMRVLYCWSLHWS